MVSPHYENRNLYKRNLWKERLLSNVYVGIHIVFIYRSHKVRTISKSQPSLSLLSLLLLLLVALKAQNRHLNMIRRRRKMVNFFGRLSIRCRYFIWKMSCLLETATQAAASNVKWKRKTVTEFSFVPFHFVILSTLSLCHSFFLFASRVIHTKKIK